MTYPDFLCIGAQKAGTTWLYQNLRQHPQIWLPPIKEIHYFDRGRRPEILSLVSRNRSLRLREYRQLKQMKRHLLQQPEAWRWYWDFLVRSRNPEWYENLFRPNHHQLSGDITPRYATLPREQVGEIYRLMPNAKIIYLLRNPISRAWSAAAMYFQNVEGKTLDQVSDTTIMDVLDRPARAIHAEYLDHLNAWESYFPRDQFFVGFFEQIQEQPVELWQSICRFLSVEDSLSHIPEMFHRKVNARTYPAPSPALEAKLADRYRPHIDQLHRRFKNRYTARWTTNALQYAK